MLFNHKFATLPHVQVPEKVKAFELKPSKQFNQKRVLYQRICPGVLHPTVHFMYTQSCQSIWQALMCNPWFPHQILQRNTSCPYNFISHIFFSYYMLNSIKTTCTSRGLAALPTILAVCHFDYICSFFIFKSQIGI